MTTNPTFTPVLNAEWTRSNAAIPDVIPPHPALLSGGWYRGPNAEVLGPGRMPLTVRKQKSAVLAFVLGILFGPVGLCYVSVGAGLVATLLTAVTFLATGSGIVPLLVIWPLCVAGSVWGAGHVRITG